jgi:hypothetical protein
MDRYSSIAMDNFVNKQNLIDNRGYEKKQGEFRESGGRGERLQSLPPRQGGIILDYRGYDLAEYAL